MAVLVAVYPSGGFDRESRALFAAAAGVLLLLGPRAEMGTVFRSPAVVGLIGLAVTTALSIVWTSGIPSDALVWGLVIAAYAVVAICGGALVLRDGPYPSGLLLAGVATIAVVSGLAAAMLGLAPFAERIGGSWRAGGPFEYPPALAVAAITTLPILCHGMADSRRSVAVAAAFGSLVVGAVVGISHSRIALALLVLTFAALVAVRPAPVPRSLVAGAAGLIGVSTWIVVAMVGGIVDGGDRGVEELALLAGAMALATAAWLPLRAAIGRVRRSSSRLRPTRCAVRVALVVVVVGFLSAIALRETPEGAGIEPVSGFTHGREGLWDASLDAFLRDPLLGAGTGGFLQATWREQGPGQTPYAHDLPLQLAVELGLAGVVLACVLYAGVALAVYRARGAVELWLLGPGAVALPLASLLDWSWYLAGAGALWALALGGVIGAGARRSTSALDPGGRVASQAFCRSPTLPRPEAEDRRRGP